jgi:hypothetical protein
MAAGRGGAQHRAMTTRHQVTMQPSERVQAVLAIIGLIVLALIARIPSA